MVKAAGLLLTGVFFAGLGSWFASGLKMRVEQLRKMESFLQALSVEMSGRLTSPSEAVKMLTEQHSAFAGLGPLEKCVSLEGEGKLFPAAWKEAFSGVCSGLTAEEMHWMEQLGSVLGQTELSMEQIQIRQVCNRLHQNETVAWETYRTQGKAYRTVGILAGAIAVIALM